MRRKQTENEQAEAPIVEKNRIVTSAMVRVRAKFPIAETKADGSVGRYAPGDVFEVSADRAKAIAPAVELLS